MKFHCYSKEYGFNNISTLKQVGFMGKEEIAVWAVKLI